MKKDLIFRIIVKVFCLTILLNIGGTLLADEYHWLGGTGNWGDINWRDQSNRDSPTNAPTSTDYARIGTYVTVGSSDITMDGNYMLSGSTQAGVIIGDRQDVVLNIPTGTSLTSQGTIRIDNRADEASIVTVNINGGTLCNTNTDYNLTLTDLNENDITTLNLISGTLNVGSGSILIGGAGSPGLATFNISGGLLTSDNYYCDIAVYDTWNISGGIISSMMGNTTIKAGGSVNIIGTNATISLPAATRGWIFLESTSNLNYVFGVSGVTPILTKRVYFFPGEIMNLSVDAAALTDAKVGDDILLIDYADYLLDYVVQEDSISITDKINLTNISTKIVGEMYNDLIEKKLYYRVTYVTPEGTVLLIK